MDSQLVTTTPKLYSYQENDINKVFKEVDELQDGDKLLYQLPTGGGKTVIFAEITKRFLEKSDRKVLVLTHRVELCRQTASTLNRFGIKTKIIDRTVRELLTSDGNRCYVAMIETLHNRVESGAITLDSFGLIIIDQAHHNSFNKLLLSVDRARVIGVTATPLSSDADHPLKDTYSRLILGESIQSLIKQGFLAKPVTWRYEVELNTLQTGLGDFTVHSSDELYSSHAMLELLLKAYEAHSLNKKTLIFNHGIFTSKEVCNFFEKAGFAIKHLDNQTPDEERKETLKWFKNTRGAILTSVSILTTGFDEPSIQTVILNRATTSLTLFHQMVGRGARSLPQKKTFSIIDLGDNVSRFGFWHDPIDWNYVFNHPKEFYEGITAVLNHNEHSMPSDLRASFSNSLQIAFDVQSAYQKAIEASKKPRTVLHDSMKQQAIMCIENAHSVSEALTLAGKLSSEINWRVKQYAKCVGNLTKNYKEWLLLDYNTQLRKLIERFMRQKLLKRAAEPEPEPVSLVESDKSFAFEEV